MNVRALATPLHVDVRAGEPAEFNLTITNASDVIDAYEIDVFGLDRQWITTEPERLSLFPGETGIVAVTIALPHDHPSSDRPLAFNVRSESDRTNFALAQIQLSVAYQPVLTMRVEPSIVTAGKRAIFTMTLQNLGNAPVSVLPSGVDPEALARFDFSPAGAIVVGQGETVMVTTRVEGGRAWLGSPRPRPLSFQVTAADRPDLRVPDATAVFLQKPRISRWIMSLLGLLAAALVFALLLRSTFNTVFNKASSNDRAVELALRGTGDDGPKTPVKSFTVTGTVESSTNRLGVSGLEAQLFVQGDLVTSVASAVTNSAGTFEFAGLGQGTYLLRLTGAGFDSLWYKSGKTSADATPIVVGEEGDPNPAVEMLIGGRPGSVSGRVIAVDPSGAVARLVVASTVDPTAEALVVEAPVGGDGTFVIAQVPAPASYTLKIVKAGYATESREIELDAAEQLEDIEVQLRSGDGVITGEVRGAQDVLIGGAVLVATDGGSTIETVSLTGASVGTFTLRNLPVPGRYTLTVTTDGYASETTSVLLTDDAQQATVVLRLNRTAGSIGGVVTLSDRRGAAGSAAGGVTVSVTGPGFEAVTTSISTRDRAGQWTIKPVPSPGIYTVTFTREGYVPEVQLVELPHPQGAIDRLDINANLLRETGVIAGWVRRQRLSDLSLLPRAQITITDGSNTYTTLTADNPAGRFEVTGIPPGSYTVRAQSTGSIDAVQQVTVLPAGFYDLDLRVGPQAAITGRVLLRNPQGVDSVARNAPVWLIPVDDFPTKNQEIHQLVCTNGDGVFTFTGFAADQRYVVAVYRTQDVTDIQALDSVQIDTFAGVEIDLTADGDDLVVIRAFDSDPEVIPQCR